MDERRRIAEKLGTLGESRTLLAEILANSPIPIQITDPNGFVVVVNEAFRRLFGSEPPRGYSVLAESPGVDAAARALIRRAFAGEPVELPPTWFEPSQVEGVELPPGTRRVAISSTLWPVHEAGGLACVVWSFRDETAGMEVQADAARLEHMLGVEERAGEWLRLTLRAARVVAWSLDLRTRRMAFSDNAEEMFGFQPPTDLDALLEHIHPEDRARLVDSLSSEGGDRPEERFRMLRPDGELLWIEARFRRNLGGDGRPVTIDGVSTDITERMRARELEQRSAELTLANRRAVESSRLKSEFLANMSHELRTPLNAIIGFSELLYDGAVDPASPQHHEFLGDIRTSARHLLQLLSDILDLAKVEAGKLDFRPVRIDLARVVGEVSAIMRSQAAEKRIRLATEIDAGLDDIVVDPGRLKQILYNYLSNAIKFTDEGGQVWVRALPEGDSAFRVEVEDTGVGIAPADLGRLFVEFQQLDASPAKRHGGTGLGLSLTRRLAEAQGGMVGVRSEPGKGSVFHAILPRRAASGPSRPAMRTIAPAGQEPLVLVVEDDPRDRAILLGVLRSAGYAVDAVATGTEAITRLRERRYQAITLDLLLPDMSGIDVLAALRASGGSPVPIVVVTALADDAPVRGLGVAAVVHKPIDAAALTQTLTRVGVPPPGGRT